ncbi:hypothetical protein AC1031_006099 [Aphanomyces cochlioides]|nr:hypothetical protein AC1031_006099 [Aphanomyces cochlioides]
MAIETIVSSVIVAFVVGGTLFDVELTQVSKRLHPRSFRWRRMANWLPLGVAYAAFYMARYNIAAGNIASVRAELDMSETDMGWIISAGSWAYALSAPLTGQLTDRIGGQYGMLLACAGAGLCNFMLGLLFVSHKSSHLAVVLLFALNVAIQGFGTSAVVKINAMWYAPSERGVFSGVFNIFVATGYYLALGSGHAIISSLGWPYLFFIPSALLLVMGIIILTCVSNAPPTALSYTPRGTLIKPPKLPAVSITKLLQNRTLIGYLSAVFCLSWARDGLLNWMYSFFDAVRATPLTSDDHAILGGAWTLGGFVGGLLCGWISDTLFASKRTPPIVLFSIFQAGSFLLLYVLAPTLSTAWLGVLVFIVSVFLLGNYTLLSYTVPADLPPHISASAVGLFTAVGYFSTGLAGVVMGSCVQRWGYTFWISSLFLTSLATALCTMLGAYFSEVEMPDETPLVQVQRRKSRASIVGSDLLVFEEEDDNLVRSITVDI